MFERLQVGLLGMALFVPGCFEDDVPIGQGAASDAGVPRPDSQADSGSAVVDASADSAVPTVDSSMAQPPTPDASDAAPSPGAFFCGTGTPSQLVSDGTNVYWVETTSGNPPSSTILSCPTSGCGAGGPVTIHSGGGAVGGLTLDDTSLYFGFGNGVGPLTQCSKAGCSAGSNVLAPLEELRELGQSIAVDATNVYWSGASGSAMKVCAKAGCSGTPSTLFSIPPGDNIVAIAVADGTLFAANIGGPPNSATASVLSCPTSGCATPTVFAASADNPVLDLVVSGTAVLWSTDGATADLLSCPLGGCAASPVTMATRPAPGWGALAADQSQVYGVAGLTYPNAIVSCAWSGCGAGPATVITGNVAPGSLAVDSTYLFWASDVGCIMRAPK